MNKYKFLFSILLLPLLSGCLDSEEYDFNTLSEVKFNPSYAIPLLHGDLGLQNLLNSTDSAMLGIREDDVLFFHYEEHFESGDINQLITLPNANVNEVFTVPATITVPPNTEQNLFLLNRDIFLSGDQQIKTILYKAGDLVNSFHSTIDLPLKISIRFPSLTKDNTELVQSILVGPNTATDATAALAGYEADLTTTSPGYNIMPFVVDITVVNNTNSEVTINQGETVNALVKLANQDYKHVTGFFGQIEHTFPGMDLAIGPFDDVIKNDISLAEIGLQMKIQNQYGVPMTLSFPQFEAVNASGEAMPIETDPAGKIFIAAPEAAGMETSTVVDVLNGADIISHNPVEIRYGVNVLLNEGLTNGNNFISDSSRLAFDLSADVPLIGSFKNIIIEDTLDIDIQNDLDGAVFNRLGLKTKLVNEFPFEGSFQVYILDESLHIVDSLLTGEQTHIITASEVTAEGDLAKAGVYDELIDISQDKFEQLSNASKLIVKAKLSTTPGPDNDYPHVKFKSTYTIAINLGILAEVEASVEL